MAGTPKNSGTWAGSGTVRGYNLQNSLGKVDIAGLYNSMSDPSGVLTRQAQDAAVVNQIINSLEAENAEAAKANTGGPKTDFPGTNRDLTSDSIGGYAVDLGSVYSLFPDAATSAVTAAMQNDYLNSLLGTGQYKGLSAAEQLDLFTKLQATNAPRFISSEEGIRPATEQETADFYDDIVDYLLGLGSVPKTTEDAVIEGTLGESKGEEIDRFFGNNAETDASIVEKIQEQVRRIGSAVGKAQDTVFDLLGIPKPDYSVIQPNAPGGTVIWGQPSGGVFGRIGTTPGGTVTGVQTGIPALDILLGKVADVASGRATTGDVLNTQTIQDIIIQTAGDELGIPGDPNQVLADIKEIGSQVFYDENTGKLGIDLGGGAAPDEVPDLAPDAVDVVTSGAALNDLPTLSSSGGDRATVLDIPTLSTGGGDRATVLDIPTLSTGGGDRATVLDIPTLSTSGDRTLTIPDFDPTETERTPTLTTDRATTSDRADEVPGGGGGGGGGGVGLGETGGIRTVSGGPGESVDIDYLYDFLRGLDQPFLTTQEEEILKDLNIYAEGGTVKKFNAGGTASNLPFGLTSTQLGLLGTAVGGIFGGLSGSGDTQGSQGYAGGIPDLMATRTAVPGAFAMDGRRPGEAGRRYFSDVQYTPVTDATGAPAIMGGAELAAMNQAALDRQKELSELGQGLLGMYGQKLADEAAAAATTGTTGTATTGTTGTATTGTTGTATTGTTGTATTGSTSPYTYTSESLFQGIDPSDGFDETEIGRVAALMNQNYTTANQVGEFFNMSPEDVNRYLGDYNKRTELIKDLGLTEGQQGFTFDQLSKIGASGLENQYLADTFGVDADALQRAIAGASTITGLESSDGLDLTEQGTIAALLESGDASVANVANLYGITPEEVQAGYSNYKNTVAQNAINETIDSGDFDAIAELITSGKAGIGDVASRQGVEGMDVVEQLLRGGYETPAEMAARLAPANEGLTEVDLVVNLLNTGRAKPEEVASYYRETDPEQFADLTAQDVEQYLVDINKQKTTDYLKGLSDEEVGALINSGELEIGEAVKFYQDRYPGLTLADAEASMKAMGYAQGGNVNGYYLGGPTDGMADQIPATIDNTQPAALSDGEFVIPADVVSHLGNGNSDSGAKELYSMMDRIRQDRTGTTKQGRQIDPNNYLA
jgi:hypothetical protein